jgi:hypothetical protein
MQAVRTLLEMQCRIATQQGQALYSFIPSRFRE